VSTKVHEKRIPYDPDIHINHGKEMSAKEAIYLCKFHEVDGIKAISYALGRPETNLSVKLTDFKNTGAYGHLRNAEFWGFQEDEMKWGKSQ
jgi:hypothetical protein